MSIDGRNQTGLTARQIEMCVAAWQLLCGEDAVELDTSRANLNHSRTEWNEATERVYLGANVLPGIGMRANYRLSMLACLAHELAHARRYRLGYARPFIRPDVLLDEAETSLHASFTVVLSEVERADLVEDARDKTIEWLAGRNREGN